VLVFPAKVLTLFSWSCETQQKPQSTEADESIFDVWCAGVLALELLLSQYFPVLTSDRARTTSERQEPGKRLATT
jgi:hypothetical protein